MAAAFAWARGSGGDDRQAATAPAGAAATAAGSPSPAVGAAACARVPGRTELGRTADLATFGNPLCLEWADRSSDAQGYVVRVRYFGTGETFEYRVGAGVSAFEFPAEAQPTGCARATYAVEVLVLRDGQPQPYTGMASTRECAS